MSKANDFFGNVIPPQELFSHLHGSQLFKEYGQFFHDLFPWDYFVTLTFQKTTKPYRAWQELNIWIRNIQKTTQHPVNAVILLDLKNPDNAHFHGLLSVFGSPGTSFFDDTWRTRRLRAKEKIERGLPRSYEGNYFRGIAHIRDFDPTKNGAWYIANRVLNDNGEIEFYGKLINPSKN